MMAKFSINPTNLPQALQVFGIVAVLSTVMAPMLTPRTEASVGKKARSIGQAILLYVEAHDGAFPIGCGTNWYGPTSGNWALDIQPYLRNKSVLISRNDPKSQALWPDFLHKLPGAVNISFVANGNMDMKGVGWHVSGLMGLNQAWLLKSTVYASDVSYPASTVMVAEAYGPNPIYGPGDILTGQNWWDSITGTGGEIPDGTRPGVPYVVGRGIYARDNRVGGVNSVIDPNSWANFIWADGRLRQMLPTATNPDSAKPALNLWIASR